MTKLFRLPSFRGLFFGLRGALPGLLALAAGLGAVPEALALGGARSGSDAGLSSSLVMVLSNEGNRHGSCTGTVIAPQIILTAAHCVSGRKRIAVAYAEQGGHVLQKVAAKALHPEFSARAKVSIDLALIRLDTPLPPRFQPLRLDQGEAEHAVGLRKTIAGFGLAIDGREDSAGTLRSATVRVLPRLYPRFLRLGAGDAGDLADLAVCTGDSGGPVLTRDGAGTTIVGVIYGREKSGGGRQCGITAQAVRVAPQRRWLDGVIARWSGRAPLRP